jgi:hypothetical protein
MKKIIASLGVALLAVLAPLPVALAQEPQKTKPRVAVFDPTATGTSIDEGTVVAVRELISSALVNTGSYNIVERSLLDKVMKEQKFSNSGAVDASQASELGKLAGANIVVVSVLTAAGKRFMASIKMIDVQTASVANQKTKTLKSADEFLDIVENLMLETIGEAPVAQPSGASSFFGISKSDDKKSAKAAQKDNDDIEQRLREKQQQREQQQKAAAERGSEEVFTSSSSGDGKAVELRFTGASSSKNPTVQLYLDGKLVGSGTLNQGFTIKFTDPHPGARALKADWSGTVSDKTFNINTSVKNYYEFEYGTTGFGYAFKIKE